MDRDQLIELLGGEGEAFLACRRALSSGARFWVDADALRASHFLAIYRRREEGVRRAGIPVLGFAAAVDALRAHGERPLRLGAVDLTDGTYHFQLFLDEDLTTVVACLGVDQTLGRSVIGG
ncbi:hypothetical protein ACFQO7_14805 [Catellatospora aurea]|uniref:Uncharacterized protein n=1 Tax=Catellatospora aurea TaxID=1337874 RepID=A0ABW2GYG4_9ACTN